MQYYGTRLSENISRREPEGYLLCLNVPVARTGVQEYLASELGLAGNSEFRIQDSAIAVTQIKDLDSCSMGSISCAKAQMLPQQLSAAAGNACGRGDPSLTFRMTPGDGLIEVFRPPEEVFSAETIASFEGMPVTDGHPQDGVNSGNIRALQKGHAHNVRRGSGNESDLLLADLIITDPDLTEQILNGKREISCGYTYELCEENGQYIQRQIRGNHVAVVDAGRAGHRVCIKDEKPKDHERRKSNMKKSLSKVLARMAKDGDVEAVAEILEEMMETEENSEFRIQNSELKETEETEKPEDPAVVVETQEGNTVAVDADSVAGILERLDRIIALLEPSAADEAAAEQITEVIGEALEAAAAQSADPQTEEVAAAMEELLDPVASVILEEEEPDPDPLQTGDALRTAVSALRPVLARLPLKEQRRVADELAGRLRRTSCRRSADADIYHVLASAGRRTEPASAELGKRIMEKRNISCRRDKNRGGC